MRSQEGLGGEDICSACGKDKLRLPVVKHRLLSYGARSPEDPQVRFSFALCHLESTLFEPRGPNTRMLPAHSAFMSLRKGAPRAGRVWLSWQRCTGLMT